MPEPRSVWVSPLLTVALVHFVTRKFKLLFLNEIQNPARHLRTPPDENSGNANA